MQNTAIESSYIFTRRYSGSPVILDGGVSPHESSLDWHVGWQVQHEANFLHLQFYAVVAIDH